MNKLKPAKLANKAYLTPRYRYSAAPFKGSAPHSPHKKFCMKKDSLVQFIGFITNLEQDDFTANWELFAGRFIRSDVKTTLQRNASPKARYKYISWHEGIQEDMPAFAKKKRSESFPEHMVKLVEFGSYVADQPHQHKAQNGLSRVFAFVGEESNDADFYTQTGLQQFVNVYQAYYQSCTYASVYEYWVSAENRDALVQHLKTRHGNEVAAYVDCPVPIAL